MSLRASRSRRLLGALLIAGAVCAAPAVALVDGDTTPPVITVTVPAEGQLITSNQGALPTAFSCEDPEPAPPDTIKSGTDQCVGDPAIDTTKHGDQQFTVHTTDHAG